VLDPALGVVAFLVPDHHHLAPVEPRESADNGLVIAEITITAKRHEVGEDLGDVVAEMRPHRMPGHLGFLPGRERCIGAGEQISALRLEPADFSGNIDIAVAGGSAEFGNPSFERGNGLFEFEVSNHCRPR
jgi:hypothetical protein